MDTLQITIKEHDTTTGVKETTPVTTQYDRTTQIDWILPVAFNIFLIVVTLWLLISLIHYGIKTKKWRHSQNSTDVLNSGLVYSSVIACAVICIFRYLVSLVYMNVGFNENKNDVCDMLADVSYASYAFVLCFVGSFLWSRQRAFYAHRLLNVNYNKVIKSFSFVSIAFIVGYVIFVVILNTLPNNHAASARGCVRTIGKSRRINWIAAAVGVAFFNLVLLGLLSYALTHAGMARHSRQKSKADAVKMEQVYNEKNSSVSDCPETLTSRLKQHKELSCEAKIRFILKKTIAFAIISILVDVALQIFSNYIENPNGHRRFINLVFDISTFLNLLFIIFSFAAYKEMMTSPCTKYN